MIIDYILYFLVVLTAYICIAKSIDLFLCYHHRKDKQKSLMANMTVVDAKQFLFKKTSLLSVLATITASAPFIGLAGTVFHIITALKQLNGSVSDITVISGPIATALYSTLWGLASAIPALIFYNLYARTLERFTEELNLLSEIKENSQVSERKTISMDSIKQIVNEIESGESDEKN